MTDADKSKDPATATTSGGSSDSQSNATGDAASKGTPVTGEQKILERLEAMSKQHENFRSLHDRQLTEIRQGMAATGAGKRGNSEDDLDPEDAGDTTSGGKRKLSAGDIATMRDNAITRFKVDHPDWKDYWTGIEEIGSSQAKAKRFVRYTPDPDTGDLVPDFYASLVDIREHLEVQTLRKKMEDASEAGQQANRDTNQAKADAAAIGGSPASIPEDALAEFKTLSYADKVKKLAEWGVIDVDPRDPPEALRKG